MIKTIFVTFTTIVLYNRFCDFMSNNKAIILIIIFALLLEETFKQIKTL